MARAHAIAEHGSIAGAVTAGALDQFQCLSVSEALVLGLVNQGVRQFVGVFGHGTTDIAEVLRVYEEAGVVRVWNVRHETAAAHAVTALKMRTGETAAVITSIGPGAMQAFAGSLAAASNGVGVYHIYGDETTHDEGFNMQQIPKDEQNMFLKMCCTLGNAYSLGEPMSVFSALRRGAVHVGKPGFSGPFYILAPMNVQPTTIIDCNLLELPVAFRACPVVCDDESIFARATDLARSSGKITIKIGSGARGCGKEIVELANLIDAAVVSGAGSSGIVPYSEPRFMSVGGSKGSISGNFAMNEADLVIVIGARGVCQWDCSGTAWKNARGIINFNTDPYHAGHYNRTVAVVGDARANLRRWIETLKSDGFSPVNGLSDWSKAISEKRAEWESFKKRRYCCSTLLDPVWGKPILTQPAAIKTACDFADSIGAVKFFDAGDVQANGFQIVEDESEGRTITDTGASYMGFAVSALLSGAMAEDGKYAFAFSGDGSFTMNPQVLIDAVEHGVRCCIIVFDNRRMAAISGLQNAQYGIDYKTNDSVAVDYVAWAGSVSGVNALYGGTSIEEFGEALRQASDYDGLSFIHVPVYAGGDELGGMGVFGDWNVGNWCERVQAEHHKLGL
jgi:3D-(3,5/4)-trihydroxycyclohexane-1,2-dione acylhydrolase (decyclizing)